MLAKSLSCRTDNPESLSQRTLSLSQLLMFKCNFKRKSTSKWQQN